MKLRWKIIWGLALTGVVGVIALGYSTQGPRKALEETRRALRRQGFKIDLSEFDLSTSGDLRAREDILTNAAMAATAAMYSMDAVVRSEMQEANVFQFQPAGQNSAVVAWKEDKLPGSYGRDVWLALNDGSSQISGELETACEAALSGPIRFNLEAKRGLGMLLVHLAPLKDLTQALANHALLEAHQGNREAAWTNLMALTRLVTAWEPEPSEISHLVRYACADMVYAATWQVIQAGGWDDRRLARLEREWEAIDFFKGLPETAAFMRASTADACEFDRQQPGGGGPALGSIFQSLRALQFRYAWSDLTYRWQRFRYGSIGTYEDEKALLLFYRDRELEIRHAIQSPTWVAMRQLPGVTNFVAFQSRYSHPSRSIAMMNMRQLGIAYQRRGLGLLAQAAEAETQRRLTVTALAVERYAGRHGSYPKTLPELAPEFLALPPTDFMDGQPLRYRPMDDGHFVLYSVGLDGIDDGGTMPNPQLARMSSPGGAGFGIQQGMDMVWPRPASTAAAAARAAADKQALDPMIQQAEAQDAAEDQQREAARQAAVAKLLLMPVPIRAREPTYRNRLLSNVLRDPKVGGTNQPTLDQLLTARRVVTGDEPDKATFEVAIPYDLATNMGELSLLVDGDSNDHDDWNCGDLQSCERATNGSCLLVWNTMYDPPGQHAVQALLTYSERIDHSVEVKGPVTPYLSTDLFQFSPIYDSFTSEKATLFAKLSELNGEYRIELKSPAGAIIKALTGKTTNGVVKVDWDLTDEQGRRYANDSLDSVFSVTLPDSGRSQTEKGQ